MKPVVYFSREITPEKVLELVLKTGVTLPGKVAIKVHSGEPGNQNFLSPSFWKPVVDHVHGTAVELPIQDLWIKDIAITTGLVSATTTSMLLKLVAQGKLAPEQFVTHRFTLDQFMDAYDTFGRAAETKAMKLAISR